MALRAGIRQSRGIQSLTSALKSTQCNQKQVIAGYRFKHGYNNGQQNSSQDVNWSLLVKYGAAAGLTALALDNTVLRKDLLAETGDEKDIDLTQEIIDKENRIRQFSRIETIFDYFATYEIAKKKGRKEVLMSVKDFYNAVTPGSSLTHGVGRGVYTILEKDDLCSAKTFENEKVPTEAKGRPSLLNEIQKQGMLTYQDFCFLLNLLSTPRRYMDIGFHCFDVSADGNVEAKEFVHVMASVTNYKGDVADLMNQEHSGLINYLFGKDRKKEINKEKFMKLQQDLMDDVLWLEFARYTKDGKTISEVDFCNHLLLCANITTKKKKQMIKRVKKVTTERGVTFADFKGFYNVLFGGSDLERAMFFLDTEKSGISSDEFQSIAKWVANCDIDRHIVDVIYALLDDDGDRNLSIKEFSPVLFQWRKSRGFQHQTIQIALGQLRI